MATETHRILGGKVHLYRRSDGGNHWFCSTFLKGKKHRKSTKEDSLSLAKDIAEDWYMLLRGQARAGLLKTERTFRKAAEQFLKEYEIITEGQRSPRWVEGHQIRLRLHLLPSFGELGLSELTAGKVQEYRVHRATTPPIGSLRSPRKAADGTPLPYKAPSRSTLHDEIVTLRQVLKTALRHGWLTHLPDLSPPYRTQGKIVHRPWFSPEEYKQLYQATRAYAHNPFHDHYRWNAEQGARLRAVHGQYRPSPGRGEEPSAPRRESRCRRCDPRADTRNRSTRQTRHRLLQKHSECGSTL